MTPTWLTVRVASKQQEATDIVSFELVDPTGAALPSFDAGAHIDVEVQPGLVRQYSLCNPPHETHRYVIGVLLDPKTRGGSKGMHQTIQSGQTIRISAPKNHFPLATDAKRSLLIAGGIGVTPILCMAEQLAARDANFAMHYCTRSPDRMAFQTRIRQSAFSAQVQFHFDDGSDDQKFNIAKTLGTPDAHTHLYVCGPGGFMDWVLNTAKQYGWPEAQVHREYFAGIEQAAAGDSFTVKTARTGKTVVVPENTSIVEALRTAGIDVSVSCEMGVCGTCLTKVLEGTPDHRDMFLTDGEKAANNQMLVCCSRAKSPVLVLDL